MSQAAVSEARGGARCRRWCYYREDGPESGLGSLARCIPPGPKATPTLCVLSHTWHDHLASVSDWERNFAEYMRDA